MAAARQSQDADEVVELVAAFRNAPDSLAFWPLARVRLAEGNLDDAIELLRYGLTRHQDHFRARLALARALLAHAAWTEAASELLLAAAADPRHGEAHLLLAEALAGTGDKEGSVKALERACELGPDDELAASLLAQARGPERPPESQPDRGHTKRRLGKLSLGKRKGSVAIEERRRGRNPHGDDESPSRPPKAQFAPEDPFAPLPPADWSEPPDAFATPAPRRSRNMPRHSQRSARAVERPRRRRGRVALLLAGGILVAAAAVGFAFRDRLMPSPVAPPRPWTMPAEVPARMALGRPSDYVDAANQVGAAARGTGATSNAAGTAAALAILAESRALALFDYGEGEPGAVETAIAAAARADRRGDSAALAVARAALAASRVPVGADAEEMSPARAEVDHALAVARGDGLVRWLDGWLRLAAGDRAGAKLAFTQADARGRGPVHAALALADMAYDEGDLDAAHSGYEAVLVRAPGHPWALVGRALIALERDGGRSRIEASAAPAAAAVAEAPPGDRTGADLDAAARASMGRRLTAWVQLLRSRARGGDPSDSADPSPDRRLAREQALFRVDRGELVDAARLRARIGAADPVLVAVLDAALDLGRGLPDDARAALLGRSDRRARLLRGMALLDLGRPDEAAEDLSAARSEGSDDGAVALNALAEIRSGKNRKPALATLELLADAAPGGLATLALGEAQLALANEPAARKSYAAVDAAGPWAYRAAVRTAELELAEYARSHDSRRLSDADTDVHRALEQAPDYLPARAVVGRLLVLNGKPAGAPAAFGPVVAAGRDSADDDLALAEGYLAGGDRDHAKEALRRALDRGAPVRAVRALAEKVDRHFAAELPIH